MVDELPRPTNLRRLWYETPWGIAYLVSLGVSVTAFVLVASSATMSGFDKFALLMIPGIALDIVLLLPISVGIFRRRFWRIHRFHVADVGLSLALLAIPIYVVCSAVFALCLVLA